MFRLVGTAFFRGAYHVFYEAFPFSPEESDRRIILHASSEDLVQWKDEGCAVYPTLREDSDGAREGSVYPNDDGSLELYCVGIRILEPEERNLNRAKPDSRIETSIIRLISDPESDSFDNVKNKKVLISDKELVKAGLKSGSARNPEVYAVGKKRYLTFIAEDPGGNCVLAFVKVSESKSKIYSIVPFKSRSNIATCRFFKIGKTDCAILEEKEKDASLVKIGFGEIDLEKGTFNIRDNTLEIEDYGEDSSSPKIAWDSRNLPYLTCSLRMNHDIRGSYGMTSLPRRLEITPDGRITSSLHPLILRRMIYQESEIKIRQTHFPQLLRATLSDGSFLTLGNTAIYFHENTLYVDRRRSLSEEENFRKVKTASIPISGDEAEIAVLIDQDCLELFSQGRTLCFITCDNDPMISVGDGVKDVSLYVLNHIKV